MPGGGLAALVLSLLAAASPPGQGEAVARLAAAAIPDVSGVVEQGVPELQDLVEGALPPPPRKVVLVTPSYGQVTVDHRAHLARRSPCKSCHGPGPVSKLHPLPPRVAHERCIGCHKAQERGPTNCKQCHQPIPPPPPAPVVVADAKASAPATPVPPPMPAWVAAVAAEPAHRADFLRSADVGYSALATSGRGVANGLTARIAFDVENALLVESFDYVSGSGSSRLLGLFGGGAAWRVHRRTRAFALAVGGFDLWTSNPVMLSPALGGRVGIEWESNVLFRNVMSLSVTGLTALGSRTDPSGASIGSTTIGVSASIGVPLSRPR